MGSPGLLYFDFVAVFIFLMLLGRRLQEASVAANRQRLLRQDPALQTVETLERGGGNCKRQPASVLAAGEEFRLPPGAVMPVAARLCSGRALLSLDWISGEAEPLQYSAGAVIPAGAIHLGSNALTLVACESWSDSLLARLVADDPAKATTSNAATLWLDRTLRIYLSLVLAAAVIGSAAWLWKGAAWTQAAQVFVSVLVVSCPCALGVAVPLAHDMAVARLRAVGLFVRSPDLWGRLLRVRKIVFDKTGTLTLDTPRLLDPEALALLPAAASRALSTLVTESRHPISAGLREALVSQSLFHPESDRRAEEICGYGLRFEDAEGMAWELRRPVDREAGTQLEDETDHADTLLTKNAQVAAAFRFAETGRRDAAEIIGGFQKNGLPVFLLSGDREPKVQAMARSLGIPADHAFGRRNPEAKGRWMQARGGEALFIGDGANDALAAQAASCSGSLAVDRTLLAEHSDFYFLSRSLQPLQLLFETAKLRRTAVRRAFILALIYNFFAMILALTGRMNPLLEAVLMPLSSLATIFTVALTMNRRQDPRGAGRAREVPLPPALAITP
jgi:Cu2+-exporting ATPase